MLSKYPAIAYIPASDLGRARKFYEETIGLKVKEAGNEGVMYECGQGTQAFLYKSAGAGTNKASTLFWPVENLEAEMKELRGRGVKFEEYDMPGLKTRGGIAEGDGNKAAWFKDTEGNILALAQRLQ
jgi:predicted enzyme related to lactoylglutathione lyase